MPNKSFMEDMLTLGTGVLSNLAEARHELKSQAKQRATMIARDLDIVTREEFDTALAMLQKARMIQDETSDRLTKIEKHLNLSSVKTTVKIKTRNLPSVKTKQKAVRAKPRSAR
jgi:BMFP domain-containing protein YqiC